MVRRIPITHHNHDKCMIFMKVYHSVHRDCGPVFHNRDIIDNNENVQLCFGLICSDLSVSLWVSPSTLPTSPKIKY